MPLMTGRCQKKRRLRFLGAPAATPMSARGSRWVELYGEPAGDLIPVIADVEVAGVALTLAMEKPGEDLWLTETREGVPQHYRVGRSSIRVRRIGSTLSLIHI